MIKQLLKWALLVLLLTMLMGCSTDNSTVGKNTTKPQPQVRIETKPSPTPISATTVVTEVTSEPIQTNTPGPIYFDPTPDSDAIANQIEALMDEIESKLKNENFQLK